MPFRTTGDGAGAFDLHLRFQEVAAWFSGSPVYPALPSAIYPPATYLLLRPFLGWLPWPQARLAWYLLSIASGAALALLVVAACGGRSASQKILAALLVPVAYGTGVTIAMGQLGLPVLLATTGSVLLAVHGRGRRHEVAAGLLFAFALAKPTIAAPFFWLLLFLPSAPWAALVAAGSYGVFTFVAILSQPGPSIELLASWMANVRGEAAMVAGYGNAVNALASLGAPGLALPAAWLLLALLGLFVFLNRRATVWTLLGISAIAARLFTYHRIYDDILVVLPLAALLRLALAEAPGTGSRIPGAAFAFLFAAQLLPLAALDSRLGDGTFATVQVASWFVALAALVLTARREAAAAC